MSTPEDGVILETDRASQPSMKNYPMYRQSIISDTDQFGCRKKPCQIRVGVPGHEPFNYKSLLSLKAVHSLAGLVHRSRLFQFHFLLSLTVCIIFSFCPETAETALAMYPTYLGPPLQSLSIFTLTFLLSHVHDKWNARFENVCKTNGNLSRLTAVCTATLRKSEAESVLRYAHSIMHIYYLMLSGPLDDEKWELLRCRGLLTAEEIEKLQLQGSPAVVLYSWTSKIINAVSKRKDGQRLLHMWSTMENQLGGLRGLSAKQIAFQLTQVPYIYNNFINILLNGYLMYTAITGAGQSWFRCYHSSCDSDANGRVFPLDGGHCNTCLVFVAAAQYGLIFTLSAGYLAATKMSESYGPDPSHYDLGIDLDNLLKESRNALASMDVEPPSSVAAAFGRMTPNNEMIANCNSTRTPASHASQNTIVV